MFNPWYSTAMLALESASVINLRLAKIGLGGFQAVDEANLMVAEKINAGAETIACVMAGATINGTIERYRAHVAANQARLSAEV